MSLSKNLLEHQKEIRNLADIDLSKVISGISGISGTSEYEGDYFPLGQHYNFTNKQSNDYYTLCVRINKGYLSVQYDSCLPSAYDQIIPLTGYYSVTENGINYDVYTYFVRNTSYYNKQKMVTVNVTIKHKKDTNLILFSYKSTISKHLLYGEYPSYIDQQYTDIVLYKGGKTS